MASKKSGGAVAVKKKPAMKPASKSAVATKLRPKATATSSKPTKPVVKKALTINAPKPGAPAPAPKPALLSKGGYSVHPGVSRMQKWIAELKENTGRTLEEWVNFVRTNGPTGAAARRNWLQEAHRLGSNSAWEIAGRAEPGGSRLVDDDPVSYLKAAVVYVEEMYAGGKAGLKPLHDRLLEIARTMGKDIRVCPCKTVVPIYRRHVIAQIFPAGRTRIDFGFALRDTPASGRLIATGGWEKKDRITHRIPITSLAEIDSEVERWLRFAYELDA